MQVPSNAFHKVQWRHFFRCGGQIQKHLCRISSGFCVPKTVQIGLFYSTNKNVAPFGDTLYSRTYARLQRFACVSCTGLVLLSYSLFFEIYIYRLNHNEGAHSMVTCQLSCTHVTHAHAINTCSLHVHHVPKRTQRVTRMSLTTASVRKTSL